MNDPYAEASGLTVELNARSAGREEELALIVARALRQKRPVSITGPDPEVVERVWARAREMVAGR